MGAWNSNLRKGVDLPTWDWLAFYPGGLSYNGSAHAYDGSRYIYWLIQHGSTTAASTTQLWRFDTWSDGWQFLGATTNSYSGLDLKYDSVRNVLWMTTGNGSTEWRIFNLNTTAITTLNQTIQPYTFTTITTVLPAAAGLGAAIMMIVDSEFTDPAIAGTVASGSTSTIINSSDFVPQQGHAGMRLRLTSGTYSGEYRTISSVNAAGTQVTVTSAFSGAPAANDTYIIEYAQGTATGTHSSSTLQDTSQSWTTNFFANMDVLIVSGTGAGQRRRIASNNATTLTLASTVIGNARTGNWSITPDNTSVYEIVPSSDFIYYMSGSNGTGFYRIDVATGLNAQTWTTLTVVPATVQGGGDLVYTKQNSPYTLHALRGNSSANIYQYNIGLNTWTSLPTTYMGSEVFNTGAGFSSLDDKGKLLIHVQSSTRILEYRLNDGFLSPIATVPYAATVGYDGHRVCKVTTSDGVKWIYLLRAGGQEFYRYAIEHL
jgi:hypothetical protein